MKNFTKTILTSVSAALISSVALAGSHMSMEMTIVSWGGAYSNSQLKAYHEPYSAKTGVTILNDDSSSTAVAQLRAMNEANNITCLLYTSPSPRDKRQSRMPSSA